MLADSFGAGAGSRWQALRPSASSAAASRETRAFAAGNIGRLRRSGRVAKGRSSLAFLRERSEKRSGRDFSRGAFPAQSAANWNKSIGTEVPPTKAVCAGLRRRRAQSRPTGSKCFCNPAQQAW
ncbi:DUF6053 domain-containing protein [Lysobacter enzymogenes]|uniref:DUF6053 domain-containing protein n=1 Tax=Lysobacter enzymogenes TaxID=69 RepID=UPI003D2F7CD2